MISTKTKNQLRNSSDMAFILGEELADKTAKLGKRVGRFIIIGGITIIVTVFGIAMGIIYGKKGK